MREREEDLDLDEYDAELGGDPGVAERLANSLLSVPRKPRDGTPPPPAEYHIDLRHWTPDQTG